MSGRVKIIIIALLIVVLMITAGLFFYSRNFQLNDREKLENQVSDDLPAELRSINLLKITTIPTIPLSKGGGLDTNSVSIVESTKNIEILDQNLPFFLEKMTENGIKIYINIAPQALQPNKWTLVVDIDGIDYQLPPDDPEYIENKNAFLEGAREVFEFIKDNRVNSDKILIEWGETEYVRNTSDKFLNQ
jgi:hypothetical protein